MKKQFTVMNMMEMCMMPMRKTSVALSSEPLSRHGIEIRT